MTDNTYDPDEILTGAETELQEVQDSIRAAANWFHEHEGEMFERREAIDRLQEHLDVREELAQRLVSNLVSDTVDPVVQATNDSGRFVGVVEYDEYDGVYTYLDYHDVFGKRKRAVCAQCVKQATVDTEVTHATENDPNGSFSGGASYEQLVTAVHNHYEQEHNVVPQDVETGASLATNTTIGGNTAYHTGNLADRGAVTITPSTSNQTIAEGYHNGNGYVEGDGSLTSGNIKDGVNIFGVNGNFGSSLSFDFSNTPVGFTAPSSTQSYSNSGTTDVEGTFPSKVKAWNPPIPVTSATVTKYGRDKMYLRVEENGSSETYTDTGIDGSITVSDVRVKKLEVDNDFYRDTPVDWSIDADLDVYQIIKDSANVS